MSCCKRSTDIVCYSGLNDGFGKKARIGNLRSAGNNDYDIQFSVIGNKSAIISEGLKVKYRSSVAYLLDEFTIAEDPCRAVIFVERKWQWIDLFAALEMSDISCTVTILFIHDEVLVLRCFACIIPFSWWPVVEPSAPCIVDAYFIGIGSVISQNRGRPEISVLAFLGINSVLEARLYSLRRNVRDKSPVVIYMAAVGTIESKRAA